MASFIERRPYLSRQPAALVVGCGDMGLAAARVLGERHPLILTDIDGDRLEQAVSALNREGFCATGKRCDITDRRDTEALARLLANGNGLRAIAHVAGVGAVIGDWRKVLRINLAGPHLIAEAARGHMVPGGAAIFVASVASRLVARDAVIEALLDAPLAPDFPENLVAALGREPDPQEAYNLSKLGVVRMAEKLAVGWGEREVRVLSLSPGMIDTPMARASGARLPSATGQGTVDRSERVREVPLARQGTTMEIARTLGFLASDQASYISGIDVLVDGGLSAAWRDRGSIDR